MKKIFSVVLLGVLLIIGGCEQSKKDARILAKINNYVISVPEFEKEFRNSPFARQNSLESRKAFLNNLIDKKLILQEAQRQGIDKEPEFLKSIERFWEQSLLKVALEKKSNEIAGRASAGDNAVKEAYEKMVRAGKTSKTYEQMYQQIKWEITKEKETELMNDWLSDLHKKAGITVDEDVLKEGCVK